MDVNQTIREVADRVFKLAKERDRLRKALENAPTPQPGTCYSAWFYGERAAALTLPTADDVRGILDVPADTEANRRLAHDVPAGQEDR